MEHKWNATFKNVENFVQAWADEWEFVRVWRLQKQKTAAEQNLF